MEPTLSTPKTRPALLTVRFVRRKEAVGKEEKSENKGERKKEKFKNRVKGLLELLVFVILTYNVDFVLCPIW